MLKTLLMIPVRILVGLIITLLVFVIMGALVLSLMALAQRLGTDSWTLVVAGIFLVVGLKALYELGNEYV